MNVYICPICMANLHRSKVPGMGRCDDCMQEYPLDRKWSMELMAKVADAMDDLHQAIYDPDVRIELGISNQEYANISIAMCIVHRRVGPRIAREGGIQ